MFYRLNSLRAFCRDLLAVRRRCSNATDSAPGLESTLCRSLREIGPCSVAALSRKTGCAQSVARLWLCRRTADGLVTYDLATGRFALAEPRSRCAADGRQPVDANRF